MTDITPGEARQLLDLDLGDNEAYAPTLREYLTALLRVAWTCGDNLKRAFGTSGWRSGDVYTPMFRAGLIEGTWHSDPDDEEGGWPERIDEAKAEELVLAAIDALGGVSPEGPSTVTVATPGGDEHWQARQWERQDDGSLNVISPDAPGGSAALYAPGTWGTAFHPGLRVASVPDPEERIATLERVIREMDNATYGEVSDGVKLANVRLIAERHRNTGK